MSAFNTHITLTLFNRCTLQVFCSKILSNLLPVLKIWIPLRQRHIRSRSSRPSICHISLLLQHPQSCLLLCKQRHFKTCLSRRSICHIPLLLKHPLSCLLCCKHLTDNPSKTRSSRLSTRHIFLLREHPPVECQLLIMPHVSSMTMTPM